MSFSAQADRGAVDSIAAVDRGIGAGLIPSYLAAERVQRTDDSATLGHLATRRFVRRSTISAARTLGRSPSD